ncbi:MAG: hypothetical protein ACI89D_001609 [Bermanella sp.]|jgi:hypothetical protein
MATTFVIQNQNGHYWSKQKDWTDGRDRRVVYRTADKVDAINLVFELSSKDIGLRASHLECDVDDFGNPLIEASAVPLPAATAIEAGEADANTVTDTKVELVSEALENSDQQPHIQSD